jgi:hypothetical protein
MMRKPALKAAFFLAVIFVFATMASAQNAGAPAGQKPAQGNQPAPAAAPAPQGNGRGAGPVAGPPHDPHDLVGVWNVRGFANTYGKEEPQLTPWGQQQFKLAKSSNGGDYNLDQTNDPVITKCYPPGVPRIYLQPFPLQFVQAPTEIIILYEYDHTVRHIFTDGRKHPDDVLPTYMGDSIGTWNGDTLVVDTVGFNDKTWLDRLGHGHSDQLHVIERFQRLNLNDLEMDLSMEDPKALAKPWTGHLGFQLHPTWRLEEQDCADNDSFLGFEK